MPELLLGLTQYFQFYNYERHHRALGYATPVRVYSTAKGGGAKILDKFGGWNEKSNPPKALGTDKPLQY